MQYNSGSAALTTGIDFIEIILYKQHWFSADLKLFNFQLFWTRNNINLNLQIDNLQQYNNKFRSYF